MNFQIKFDYKGNKGTWLNLAREQGNRAKILMGTRELIPPPPLGDPQLYPVFELDNFFF